ncbi:hypothetical protein [Micromonospora sp. NPDC048843]|uniref:hypothetical protein n=1 Tax=Micromonospora sp. NPDC048843 TaxID=3155389 RepID=UPI003405201D
MYCSILLISARSWAANAAADDVKAHTNSDTGDLRSPKPERTSARRHGAGRSPSKGSRSGTPFVTQGINAVAVRRTPARRIPGTVRRFVNSGPRHRRGLSLFGRQGERLHVRARPAAAQGKG